MTPASAVRLVLAGRVQGVGFRWYVARAAQRLPVRGWIRNLPDGRVEIVIAGDGAAVSELESLARHGPRLSRVDNVEKSDVPHELVDAKIFEIR